MNGYLTTRNLSNAIDLPVSLPATEVKQGDWLVVASVKIAEPMKLTYRLLIGSILASAVPISQIGNSNKIIASLGLAYVVLRRDYVGGNPGGAGALDTLVLSGLFTVTRDTDSILTLTTPGVYSWVIANNMQPSSTSLVPTSTEINFRLAVTGQARLFLDANG